MLAEAPLEGGAEVDEGGAEGGGERVDLWVVDEEEDSKAVSFFRHPN